MARHFSTSNCYLLLQKHLNVTVILHTSPKNQNVCIFKTDILETQIIPGYKHFLETKHENLHQHERKLDFLFNKIPHMYLHTFKITQ